MNKFNIKVTVHFMDNEVHNGFEVKPLTIRGYRWEFTKNYDLKISDLYGTYAIVPFDTINKSYKRAYSHNPDGYDCLDIWVDINQLGGEQ